MTSYRVTRSNERGVRVTFRELLIGGGLLGAGLMLGSGLLPSSRAWGEVRLEPPPKAFETGGQMSVPILKDISATLHQMDARLARMETVATLLQAELQLGKRSQ